MFLSQLHPTRWLAIIGAIVLFLVVLSGKVRYTSGDSRYALLASQAILEHGTWRLDDYAYEYSLREMNHGALWTVYNDPRSHHIYYNYAVGSSIFALPVVALARAMGSIPADRGYDEDLQIFIAATILAIMLLLMFRMALLYLDDWAALVFTLLIMFGTSLASTLGTALWSADFTTLFVLIVLLELAEYEQGKREKVRGMWTGLWLFSAYICRPTTMFFAFAVLAYLAWKQRQSLWGALSVCGGLFLLFMLWSWLEMKKWLPWYYQLGARKPMGDYGQNLRAVMVGPARGLFSFTPALGIGFLGWAFARRRRDPLFLAIWLWFTLHVGMVLRASDPWGGWCYGPRYFTETIPGLALALLMTFKSIESTRERIRNAVGGLFMVLSCFGVFVHTWQGLYHPDTIAWNDHPSVNEAWACVRWDWRYPQFLASPHQLAARKRENDMGPGIAAQLDQVPAGGALLVGTPDAVTREIFRYWNRHDVLHKGKPVFNSVAAIFKAGFIDFWYHRSLGPMLEKDWRVRLEAPREDRTPGPDSTMDSLPPLLHATILPEARKR